MTNHEFTMRAAQIAKRAASWAHDNLTMGTAHALEQKKPEDALRFVSEIEEMLKGIYTRPGFFDIAKESKERAARNRAVIPNKQRRKVNGCN